MKFCTTCGKQLRDDAKFCTGCGSPCKPIATQPAQPAQPVQPVRPAAEPVSENVPPEHREPLPEPSKPPKGKREKAASRGSGKKTLRIVLGAVLAAVLVAGLLVLRWYTGAEQRILRALDAGNYEQAESIVREDGSLSENEKLEKQLLERVAAVRADYEAQTLDYDAASRELDTIGKLGVTGVSQTLGEARSYIDALNESRTNYAAAEACYQAGDYAGAITNYRLVSQLDGNYQTAQDKLSQAEEKYREAELGKAAAFAGEELYDEAIQELRLALGYLPNDSAMTEQIHVYETSEQNAKIDNALAQAEGYSQAMDYLSAYLAVHALDKAGIRDAKVSAAESRYAGLYRTQVLGQVDDALAKEDFAGALAALNAALKHLPQDEVLQSKLDAVKAQQPIPITTLLEINKDQWSDWNAGSPTDPFGNDYSGACNFIILGFYGRNVNEHYIEYRLYGEYSRLTGSIAPQIETDVNYVARLQVYADDVLVYTSPDVGRKTDAIPFSVNVSGAEYIKIVVSTGGYSKVIVSNLQLWP